MSSTTPGVKPKIWKRYISDSFKVGKKEQRNVVTDHLNIMDSMGVSSSWMSQRLRVAFHSRMHLSLTRRMEV